MVCLVIATATTTSADESYDLRKEVSAWVEKNIGAEYVDEALDKYDTLNSGGTIGGFQETAVFIHMIERIKMEAQTKKDERED